jgi:hypothetical protein
MNTWVNNYRNYDPTLMNRYYAQEMTQKNQFPFLNWKYSPGGIPINEMEFVSIGGWCGTKIALKQCGYMRASYPFDYVRSSILGVIDCFETNFLNYFPKDTKKQENGYYLSSCCEFQHEDIANPEKIISFNRKIKRFRELLQQNKPVCFLRTVCLNDYNCELKYYKKLQKAIDDAYPRLKYIICFIITKQNFLSYYRNIDNRTFIFTINNTNNHNHSCLLEPYNFIFNFIFKNNLFCNIPNSNNIELIKTNVELETTGLMHT